MATREEFSAKEKAGALITFLVLIALAVLVAPVTWLVGPFGPTIHAYWLKWVVTAAVFVIIFLCLLCLCGTFLVFARDTQWGDAVLSWFDEIQKKLEDAFTRAEERRRDR